MTKTESLLLLYAFFAVLRLEQIAAIQRAKFSCLSAAIRAPFDDDPSNFPDFEEVSRLMTRHRELRT